MAGPPHPQLGLPTAGVQNKEVLPSAGLLLPLLPPKILLTALFVSFVSPLFLALLYLVSADARPFQVPP